MPDITADLIEDVEITAALVPAQGIRTEFDTVYLYNPEAVTVDIKAGRYIEITAGNTINNTMPVDSTVSPQSNYPVSGRAVSSAITQATATFVFDAAEASDVWEITHNLNKYPTVTVVDSAGTEQTGCVEYVNENVCRVKMNSAFKGKAYLN